eukprot:3343493-Amphidinium_carterae.1
MEDNPQFGCTCVFLPSSHVETFSISNYLGMGPENSAILVGQDVLLVVLAMLSAVCVPVFMAIVRHC